MKHELVDEVENLEKLAIEHGIHELHPDIARGLVELFMGTLDTLVTAKRGKYPNDPALNQPCETHLDHARDHVREAYYEEVGDVLGGVDDDGLWHGYHCAARLALCLTRASMAKRNGG